MSTRLRDPECPEDYGPHSLIAWGNGVDLIARKGSEEITATMDRIEFTKAVETELNAIVIDRADLPEVKHAEGLDYYTDNAGWKRFDESSADYNRRLALHHLALAEYLDAHPPVDPAVVRALALDIGELDEAESADGLAHRLAVAGWRKEVSR